MLQEEVVKLPHIDFNLLIHIKQLGNNLKRLQLEHLS